MRRLFHWLGNRPWFVSVPILIVAGVVAYVGIYSLLVWANSTEFCGTTCHIMTPEYTAYQNSYHARVRCADCHVGPGLGAEVEAKWQGIRELWMNVTRTYETPIPSPVESLRPAKETCEECHWPEVFYEDRAIEIVHYAQDEQNTRSNTFMLVKIGGGTLRQGQGRGIHWHIENKVEYIALDPQRQQIPWVRAQLNGETVTFMDVTSSFEEEELLADYEVRVMDCMDCHNRATHIFRSARRAVTEAMANGLLPTDLPYFYKQAVETMEATYPTQQDALAAIEAIVEFYRQNYRDLYAQRAEEINQAVARLKEIYEISHFPDFEIYPETYPDNEGHSEAPGCFRCHDGKHLAPDGQASIRLHCNICHTIPQTAAEGEPPPPIPYRAGWEPPNHLDSAWMADHRYIIDETCAGCHDMPTFCANVNCHGRSWPYVDLSVIEPPFPLPIGPVSTPTPEPTATAGPSPEATAAPTPPSPAPTAAPTSEPTVVADPVERGRQVYAQYCTACHPTLKEVTDDNRVEREDLVEAIREGKKDEMPPIPLTDSQIEDLIAFLEWWLAHPGEPAPTVAPAPTAGPAPTSAPGPTGAPAPTSPAAAPSFSADILPVLNGKCGATCHGAASALGGFNATDYAGVSAFVVPGDPDNSSLVQVQRGQHPAKLTPEELDLVIAWIQAGAPDN